ncbi:rho/rac/cdc gtpase-activating protein [Anaeramoeba flamelloides]|uniref:Rho/rac/cdc gtpase-activating protein n=1 Tax=Anaeramoeba flamelloides TaxID=1746091 RepID=A0ABQ8YCA2_9EUKA|nr:rho/rac/cdc gtpase-activating protein [Anaeramoeba flamelloides]
MTQPSRWDKLKQKSKEIGGAAKTKSISLAKATKTKKDSYLEKRKEKKKLKNQTNSKNEDNENGVELDSFSNSPQTKVSGYSSSDETSYSQNSMTNRSEGGENVKIVSLHNENESKDKNKKPMSSWELKKESLKKFGSKAKKQSIKFGGKARDTSVKLGSKAKHKIKSLKEKEEVEEDLSKTRIFGVTLQVAIEREGRDPTSPPSIIEKAIMYLEEKGKFETGIYRLSGSIERMEYLKLQFDRGVDVSLDTVRDENTVASLIKLYFRELPEPIFGEKYTPRLPKLAKSPREVQIKRLNHVWNNIPEVNRSVLRWLIPHLSRVSLQAEKNKMTPQNLAIVFAPTLRIPAELIVLLLTDWVQIFCKEEN